VFPSPNSVQQEGKEFKYKVVYASKNGLLLKRQGEFESKKQALSKKKSELVSSWEAISRSLSGSSVDESKRIELEEESKRIRTQLEEIDNQFVAESERFEMTFVKYRENVEACVKKMALEKGLDRVDICFEQGLCIPVFIGESCDMTKEVEEEMDKQGMNK